MKTLILLVSILFLLPNITLAADEWDKEDIALATVFTAATIIDWGQTRDIVKRRNEDYYEKYNKLLGKYPSIKKVNIYMPTLIVSTITAAHYLPNKPGQTLISLVINRKTLLYAVTAMELFLIHNNRKIGLTINF